MQDPSVHREARSATTIAVPAFNEAQAIGQVVNALREKYPQLEVMVIDDGSTDDTGRVAEAAGARVIRHGENRGYGATWRSAAANACGDTLIFFDGDGQMATSDVGRLLVEMDETGADMVSGARVSHAGSPLTRRPGKALLRQLGAYLVGRPIADLNCGLRAVRVEVLRRYLHLLPAGFSASTTSLMVFIQRGYLVRFIPVEIGKRTGKSSVRYFSDGFGTLILMIRLVALFNPLRFFVPVSLGLITIAVLYSLAEAVRSGLGIPVLGSVLFIGGLQIFLIGIVCDQVSALRLERFERSPPGMGDGP